MRIRIHHYDNNLHNRRDAARFITMGYRVTDDYGRDLTIETRVDGSRHVVIGTDALGSYHDTIASAAVAGAARMDQAGRPTGLPERELTDYESGKSAPSSPFPSPGYRLYGRSSPRRKELPEPRVRPSSPLRWYRRRSVLSRLQCLKCSLTVLRKARLRRRCRWQEERRWVARSGRWRDARQRQR